MLLSVAVLACCVAVLISRARADYYTSGSIPGLTNPYLIPAYEVPGGGPGVTQYLVFHSQLAANFTRARSRCLAIGGDLADVESVQVLNYLAARLHEPAYVASWLGSHMGFACMAVYPGGAIAVPEQGCLGVIANICEVPVFSTASIHIGLDLDGKGALELAEEFPEAKARLAKGPRPDPNNDEVTILRNGKPASSTAKAVRTATMTIYGSIATNPALPCCKCC